MNRADKAVAGFKGGLTCSQAVLLSFAEDCGLTNDKTLELTTGCGGGMARTTQTCGAVTGAYLVIGLKFGGTTAEDKATKENTDQVMRTFNDKFKDRNQSLICKELLNCDISTPAGLEEARQKSLFITRCPKMIRDAVEILKEISVRSSSQK